MIWMLWVRERFVASLFFDLSVLYASASLSLEIWGWGSRKSLTDFRNFWMTLDCCTSSTQCSLILLCCKVVFLDWRQIRTPSSAEWSMCRVMWILGRNITVLKQTGHYTVLSCQSSNQSMVTSRVIYKIQTNFLRGKFSSALSIKSQQPTITS